MKILTTADWHLRSTVPSCLDMSQYEWIEAQKAAVKKVYDIVCAEKVDEVYVGGDIFHSEQTASFEVIQIFQDFAITCGNINIPVYILAGNHDLPNHSSYNIDRAAIGVIFNSKGVFDMNFSKTVMGCSFDHDHYGDRPIIFKHTLTMPKEDIPGDFVQCETPESLLEKYPNARIIFTGDYHVSFAYKSDKGPFRWVINSGCLTRQAVDFKDYDPVVFVSTITTEDGTNELVDCKPISVKVDQKFVENGQQKGIDRKIQEFAEGVKVEAVTLDFIGSLRKNIENKAPEVKDKVEDWISQAGQ